MFVSGDRAERMLIEMTALPPGTLYTFEFSNWLGLIQKSLSVLRQQKYTHSNRNCSFDGNFRGFSDDLLYSTVIFVFVCLGDVTVFSVA